MTAFVSVANVTGFIMLQRDILLLGHVNVIETK